MNNVGVVDSTVHAVKSQRSTTHLQDTVFREVCTVDCVFHFVFAIKSSQ